MRTLLLFLALLAIASSFWIVGAGLVISLVIGWPGPLWCLFGAVLGGSAAAYVSEQA